MALAGVVLIQTTFSQCIIMRPECDVLLQCRWKGLVLPLQQVQSTATCKLPYNRK